MPHDSHRLPDRFETLARVPVAPFREQWICSELDRVLSCIPGLEVTRDRFGNRIARLQRGRTDCGGFTFVAHLDHPGFTFPRGGAVAIAPRRFEACFEGYVLDPFFEEACVRLFRSADDPGVVGRIVSVTPRDPETRVRTVIIETSEDAGGAVLATWDVPAFEPRDDGLIHARGCDDLAGCAAIIEALERASQLPEAGIRAVFTRAEEAGYCGAMCMLAEEQMPALLSVDDVFISVEASSEKPGVAMGDGAVIRAGDRTMTFDPMVTDTLWAIARDRKIAARRALMDGGTCEATPFSLAGLRAGALCVPLRNYHNMPDKGTQVAAEGVALSDIESLVELIVAVASTPRPDLHPRELPAEKFERFLRLGRNKLVGG